MIAVSRDANCNDRDNESMDSVDGKHDYITIPNDRDNESMDYKYS